MSNQEKQPRKAHITYPRLLRIVILIVQYVDHPHNLLNEPYARKRAQGEQTATGPELQKE